MGTLRNIESQRPALLLPETTVGRSQDANLVLAEQHASAQHAVIRWSGADWRVKDCASTNGTYLDGVRLAAHDWHALKQGARLNFGAPNGPAWELSDGAEPQPLLLTFDDTPAVALIGDALALPDVDHCAASLFRDAAGAWWLDSDNGTQRLEDRDTFRVDQRSYRICIPSAPAETDKLVTDVPVNVLGLEFRVAPDWEHIELVAHVGSHRIELGSRSHNYLLLHLARHRLADRANGQRETQCGWIYQDELSRDLASPPPTINLEVFRARQHLARGGVPNALQLIERRPRTRQMRIGFEQLQVVSL